jgi:formylglycine-generating enzyme required for sulfatase activity
MKKLMLFFFTLLLFAAATTTATAQDKPKLAVFVVNMDDWMLGDVLAHLVGEELNRGNTYDVVTRRNDVQNKLKALRRGYDRQDSYLLRRWAIERGIATLCVVTTMPDLNFSLKLLDVSSGAVHCSGSRIEPNAVALKQLAWSLTGSIGDGCTPGDYTEPSIEMEMVYVEGGAFMRGCVNGRDNINGYSCEANEYPADLVSVGSFLIGKYEVTQGQWKAVMGTSIDEQLAKFNSQNDVSEGFHGVGADFPMYYVSWYEAKAFCDTLSARTGKLYRLATEEEWEYAARGGQWSRGYQYSGSDDVDSVAWHSGNSGDNGGSNNGRAHAVGTTKKQGNELGICDMSGNVREWCSSKWRPNYNASEDGSMRVIRSGSWMNSEDVSRISIRSGRGPSNRYINDGFRVV